MNKKGFTLIEVTVALGILIFVFAGVVNLILLAVNLEIGARERTAAINLAQKKMSEAVATIDDGCSTGTLPPDGESTMEGRTYAYDISENVAFDYGNGLDATKFRELVVNITWTDKRGNSQDYSIKQAVKR